MDVFIEILKIVARLGARALGNGTADEAPDALEVAGDLGKKHPRSADGAPLEELEDGDLPRLRGCVLGV
jgi:hypothetical protein